MKIETERLIIRNFFESDLSEFEKLLNIKEVPGWVMQKDKSVNFLKWNISNYAAMDIVNGIVCLGIFNRVNGCVLGAIGAGEHDDLHETEIFYNLLDSARGFGYATEACNAVTMWALAHYSIPYIIGTAAIDNIPSQKVLERCGYEYINEQELLIHIVNKKYKFKYYRCYPKK